jgi:hypothetical protein
MMEIVLEIILHAIGHWVHRKKPAKPVPKIVGSVPYCPLTATP